MKLRVYLDTSIFSAYHDDRVAERQAQTLEFWERRGAFRGGYQGAPMRYFDYEKVAKDAGIPPEKLTALGEMVRREFPRDDMMFELHLLRTCMAVRDGYTTVDEILSAQLAHAA